MNRYTKFDAGFSHQIGKYSDAVRVSPGHDLIFVSGTPGFNEKGEIPDSFEEEARQAWRNIEAILSETGASIDDIVSVRQYLTRAEDIKTYVGVRSEMIKHEPQFMLMVVNGLVWPSIHLEIEVIAALATMAEADDR